jgi:hypothetical protein
VTWIILSSGAKINLSNLFWRFCKKERKSFHPVAYLFSQNPNPSTLFFSLPYLVSQPICAMKKTMLKITALFCLLGAGLALNAQNTRINDNNRIGWWANFVNIKLNKSFSLHGEYQWRREDYVNEWQQSLLRTGLNYQINPKTQLRVGYAWIETFPYGDFPINAAGRDFTEHRTYQMITLVDKPGFLDVSHRFMLEQRWIGRYLNPQAAREDDYFFVNRLRYMFRVQSPLKGNTIDNKEFYAAAYDEIFIGFGGNVNENVFDQNRIGVLLGYRFSNKLRIEGGFFNQILQLPREITPVGGNAGRNVFQHNTGFIVNTFFSLDWSKQK